MLLDNHFHDASPLLFSQQAQKPVSGPSEPTNCFSPTIVVRFLLTVQFSVRSQVETKAKMYRQQKK